MKISYSRPRLTTMKYPLLLAYAILLVISASAQRENEEGSSTAFHLGGTISLMGGQSGTRNWAPAGSEKFSLTAYGNLQLWANKHWNQNKWSNNLEAAYALINTSSQGVRKIDDKLEFYSKFNHAIKNQWGVGGIATLRTQFVNGYDYTEVIPKRISGFFAPAYLVVSPGIQYETSTEVFSFHFGPGARWVVVSNAPYSLNYQGGIKPDGTKERTLAELYGVDPQRELRFEMGPFLFAAFNKEVMKNVHWESRLNVSSDFVAQEPLLFDVYWTNTIGMKVNNWLRVNYNFDLYYDDDVKMFGANKDNPATQMKSLLGVGLAAKF